MITNHNGISGSRTAYMLAAKIRENKRLLTVVSTGQAAARLAEDLVFYLPELNVIVLSEEEPVEILYEARDRSSLIKRIQALSALDGKAPADTDEETGKGMTAVIAPVSAALRLTESPERFRKGIVSIRTGQQIDPHDLRQQLSAAGYMAAAVTESPGEFTSRGGILDIFPPAMEEPVRIEFFDDEIDSIRTFDTETQRSTGNLSEVTVSPAAEFIPDNAEKEKALGAIMKEYGRILRRFEKEHAHPDVKDGRVDAVEAHRGRVRDIFEHNGSSQIFADFLEYFDVEKCRLWDHAISCGIAVSDPASIMSVLPESATEEDFFDIYKNASGITAKRDVDIYTPFPEAVAGVEKFDRIDNVKSRQIAPFNGHIELFASETEKLASAGYRIVIAAGSAERNDRVREYLEIAEVSGDIAYRTGTLSTGFVMEDDRICFITGGDIFSGNIKNERRRPKRKSSRDSIQFSDLHKGDYVVHEVHGIGRFEGIAPVTADGITRDYLLIRYAGSDMLYIPTEQLDVIQKYIGNSGNAPALSRLSGGSWKRTRERARKAIMEIAEDLVKLYAKRKAEGGYAFGKDTVWQTEFEEAFPYTETDDQLRAAEEIKEDMQKPLPMDRLLCGDVGYGKTEVAARAVFKCISEGKQAAILAPTTLLVNQHYHNLRERFENFPFEIEELSRFRSKSAQNATVKGIKNGRVDLVIGTHRMLSDDVKFKDLGLLVIDEEQRFGVRHKEKIKELRSNVDVLTLSATPIPRTLNMSLTGIKDISLIEEPPGDRIPVHTFVTPYDEELLRNAIERELARGGQVFVVNNRITGLNQVAEAISRLVPQAKIGIGHGRMNEETLENTMLDFIEGHINVLVATTIIENGIDIPNANTMIILNADRFGLAQLYQLRGRVGRSSRLAYAYLMYQPGKVLTDIARKRLAAIREFTEFGAGFKLAMKDLELRGAGNILGEAQSGHIESIGYELYCKEIDRAVRMLKGEDVGEARSDITIDLPIKASIPASYIEDESLRLEAYRRIAGIMDSDDAMDVTDELTDRYGDVPEDALQLINVAEIRSHAEYLGISRISRNERWIDIKFSEHVKVHPYVFVMAKSEYGDKVALSDGRVTMLKFHTGKDLDIPALLGLMRFLRASAEDAKRMEADAAGN
ncbi:MAG: transcription-repair coupling factor [Mogibacterium sp.]|nr:transcription-repair coupling factor [Mogibacterium sp.]